MSERRVRVRFAPSPTGALHIGGVRTALYNYLFARQHNGDLVFRIEDTDSNRFVPGAEDYIIESFRWLGIKFDEGVSFGGKHGPYRQSERRYIYKKYVDQLLEAGKAYIAFDTPEELEAKRNEIKNFQYDASTRGMMRNSLTMSKEKVDELSFSDDYATVSELLQQVQGLGVLCGTDKFRVVEQAEDGPVKSGRVIFTALPDQAGKGQRAALHLVIAPAVGKTAGNGLQVLLFRVAADLPDLLFGKAVGIDQKTVMLSDIGIFTFLSVPVHRPEDRGVTDNLRLQAGVGLHKSAGVFIPHQSTLEPAQLLDLIRERAEGLLIGIPDTGRVRDRGNVDLTPEDGGGKYRILHIQ